MQTILFVSLLGAAVLYALSRTQRGQELASDVVGGAVVATKNAAAAVADLLTPRGIRNNNPGNIEWTDSATKRWRGMVDRDGRYGIFDTAANGVRAIGGELRASFRKGQTTVRAIINEWAPPVENDTSAYVSAVARALGVGVDEPLNTGAIPALAMAIIKHENGQQPYAPADVAVWVNS